MQQLIEFATRHWELVLVLIVILGLVMHFETAGQISGIKLLSPQEVTGLINHENAVILDIRAESDYNNGHIINAISFPEKNMDEKMGKIQKYKSKSIIIVCLTGQNSPAFGAKLTKVGFDKVFALKGGTQAWVNANLPMVT